MEVREVLGIEAARQTITSEIKKTMGAHGLQVDNRHIQLLGGAIKLFVFLLFGVSAITYLEFAIKIIVY